MYVYIYIEDQFAVGDEVYGTTDIAGGAFAEYVSVSIKCIAHKPKEISWETAASIPTAGKFLSFLFLGFFPTYLHANC